MKYSLIAATALGLLGGLVVPAYANNGAVELALQSQGGLLSMFSRALVNTGVARELNENTEYTVFAPTNAAFAEIQPRVYPCFYSAQCRPEVAAILRNHILPRHEDKILYLSRWGGPIPTIGSRGIHVEEAYKDEFMVEGNKVLHRSEGPRVSVYTIDGVIANRQELAAFTRNPAANATNTVTKKTVTVRRTSNPASVSPYNLLSPGGSSSSTVIYTNSDEDMMDADERSDDTTETTTITRTRTTE